ncbi:MAG: lipoate--protein ligase family protein [Elusimicrobiota bacterium]
MNKWFFIDSPPLDGKKNMEIDESIFESYKKSKSQPVFRLYSWSPPTISLGRFQKKDKVLDLKACCADGVEIVRRITGGGAIYHGDEITYSITCSACEIGARSVKEGYLILGSFLIEAYKQVGLDACYNFQIGSGRGKPSRFCFSGMEEYDIVVDKLKMGGNAQRRSRDTIFQHGSIPLSYNKEKIQKYFKVPVSPASKLFFLKKYSDMDPRKFKKILIESFSRQMKAKLERANVPAGVA